MNITTNTFVRTPLGRIAAFDPASRLPGELKTLLRAIDNPTSLDALSKQFPAWDNVTQLFEQLQQTRLIAEKVVADQTSSGYVNSQPYAVNLLPDLELPDAGYPSGGWPVTIPMGLASSMGHGAHR
jgi:hypothetical protein